MKNILSQIPTESKIKKVVRKLIFGKKIFCPRCGSPQVKKSENRYRCRLCRKPFSLTSHSWLKGMKITWQEFWLLLWCWTYEISINQARKTSGLSKPTVREWYGRFRNHLPHDQINDVILSGIIEGDEAYRGGKKKGFSLIGFKEKKRPNRQSKMVIRVVNRPSVDRRQALDVITHHIEAGSDLWTDGSAIYRGIGNWGPVNHSYERHNKFEFALTSEIEGLWGNLTWFIRRVYHHVTKDYIEPVVNEFVARQTRKNWFENPQSVLEVILPKLVRPLRPEWRGKYQQKISQSKQSNYSISMPSTKLSTVPSCL